MTVKSKQKADDLFFMLQALELARKAKGLTCPNPSVGAIIIKANKVIAKGFHEKAGTAHAEIIALNKAGKSAKGACMYVTLEPCSTFAKTPPCTKAIIKAGIKRVVIATLDSNPINRNKGLHILKEHGIEVEKGVLECEAKKVNEDFNKFMKYKKPFITIKAAQTLDGRMATQTLNSKWITSLASRKAAHELRYRSEAILTGIGTVLSDNPKLTSRLYVKNNNPQRILLDSQLKVPLNANILKNNCPEVIIFTSLKPNQKKYKLLSQLKHVNIIKVKNTKVGLSLKEIIKILGDMNIINILIEAGPKLLSSFIKQDLVDKFIFFIAPKLLADKYALGIDTGMKKNISEALCLKNVTYNILGDDIIMEAYI
ncbi:MAG: bifunctional diaminohydroxyphosphoribosylaminopyrimidine deaminase/5-amino-6-(5-phosphoribosylamino)uracil reductase RibD [Candidatus Kappaea frigidicola]|nr:bifunctional diaminohydroxyphosphoribosylaminopyrimidine deaminase/5-amino-6-(5-phosphoribosylamino)uracil reductase RibD [Candidatus Kappaea frigidicola]